MSDVKSVNLATTAEEMMQLGLKSCLGSDRVEAHKWFNIAAMMGCEAARNYRSDVAAEMEVGEIAEAQRRARQTLTLH